MAHSSNYRVGFKHRGRAASSSGGFTEWKLVGGGNGDLLCGLLGTCLIYHENVQSRLTSGKAATDNR